MAPEKLCDSEYCKAHEHVIKTMERLERLSEGVIANQQQLIGALKDITSLSDRVRKLEDNQEDIKKFTYKVGAVIGFVAFTTPILVTVVVRLFM